MLDLVSRNNWDAVPRRGPDAAAVGARR